MTGSRELEGAHRQPVLEVVKEVPVPEREPRVGELLARVTELPVSRRIGKGGRQLALPLADDGVAVADVKAPFKGRLDRLGDRRVDVAAPWLHVAGGAQLVAAGRDGKADHHDGRVAVLRVL